MNTSSPSPAARRPPPDDAPSAPGEGRRGSGWSRRGRLGAASGLLALGFGAAVLVGPGPGSLDAAVASAADELVRELLAGDAGPPTRNVAVMPLRAEPSALAPLADDLRHRLGDHLRALAPELVLVEREDLDAVWSEHRLPMTGLLDPRRVAELGRVLGADALLLGNLGDVDGVPQLHLRLVDVETAAVLASASRPIAIGRGGAGGDRRGGPIASERGNGIASAIPDAAEAEAADPIVERPAPDPAEPPPAAAASALRPAAPSLPGRSVIGGFRLALEGCGFVEDQLVYRLEVTNLAPGERTLTFLAESTVHDTRGEDYRLQRVRVGTTVADLDTRAAHFRHRLAGGLQVTAELTFSGVPRVKKKAQLLDLRFVEGRWTAADISFQRD